jgi:hypothetical protein
MWVGLETEVRSRMRQRASDAERRRLLARARAGRAGAERPPGGYRRLREAAGFGLVRTGLWLLDARGAGS